jgi:hypothetical protein
VELLKEVGILRTRLVGRSLLCSWDERHTATKALSALLDSVDAPGEKRSDENQLYASMKHWGAGLAREVDGSVPLPVEDTLVQSLPLCRRDPDLAQVWPVVLAKNYSTVDYDRLEVLARHAGQKQAMGFMLSLTGQLMKDSSLSKFAERFRDQRVRKPQDFFLLNRTERSRRSAEEKTPKVAREWFFRMNTPLEGFQSHFDKFVKTS